MQTNRRYAEVGTRKLLYVICRRLVCLMSLFTPHFQPHLSVFVFSHCAISHLSIAVSVRIDVGFIRALRGFLPPYGCPASHKRNVLEHGVLHQ